MSEPKPKKAIRRRVIKAANSPEPTGPMGGDAACGHGGCGPTCSVRYVGPTSSMRDHHALHAARGMTHIWSAAVVTGLAIVITGAIAFNAAQAESNLKTSDGQAQVRLQLAQQIARMNTQLLGMQNQLQKISDKCATVSATGTNDGTKKLPKTTKDGKSSTTTSTTQ